MKRKIDLVAVFFLLGMVLFAPLTMGQSGESDDPSDAKRGQEERDRTWYKFLGVRWEAKAGLGYDTNVYAAPAAPYTDFGVGAAPTVTPAAQSGLYLPLKMAIKYNKKLGGANNLVAAFNSSGDFYLDSAQGNADQYVSEISLGDRLVFWEKGRREHSVYLGVQTGKNRKLFIDHDTGVSKNSAVKYTYKFSGVEARYVNELSKKLKYTLEIAQEERDYETPPAGDEYDVAIFSYRGVVRYAFTKGTQVSLDYKAKNYDYATRRSRDLTGALVADPVIYRYAYTTLGLRQRLGKDFTLFGDLKQVRREDKFVGYSDYTMNGVKLRGLWTYSDKVSLRGTFSTWDRSYPNAFAFDKPTQVAKAYDGTTTGLRMTYKINKNHHYDFDLKYTDQNSTDLRYDYEKVQIAATASWKY